MADATAIPAAAPLLFGRYRVQEQLGETRLACVYAAGDERLQRQVILHLLRKELVGQDRPHARFVSEIGQSARRSHPALLEVFDSGEAAARPFMITEHVRGRPLRGLGVLSIEQALLYMRQVAGAIATCQSYVGADAPGGLYHPPISSSNVFLVDEGRVKLLESWLLPVGEVRSDLAHYRAPELSEGQPATAASAVYSLGLLLYELITGERPVSGDDAHMIAIAHLSVRIPPLAQRRPTLYLPMAEQLVAKATARYPEYRYASAQEFALALDGLWRDLGASTQRMVAVAPPPVRHALPPAPAPAPPPDPPPAPPAPHPSGISGHMRKRSITRSVVGWLVMIGLLFTVAAGSYVGVSALIVQFNGISTPHLPSLPGLPSISTDGGPLTWLGKIFRRDEIYIVNLSEGLNLRAQPDVNNDANILTIVPNSTPVTKLEGPVVKDNIPWLRVSVEVGGQRYEGWMSLKYLRQDQ